MKERIPLEDRLKQIQSEENEEVAGKIPGFSSPADTLDKLLFTERVQWMDVTRILIKALRSQDAKNPQNFTVQDGEIEVRVSKGRVQINGSPCEYENIPKAIVNDGPMAGLKSQLIAYIDLRKSDTYKAMEEKIITVNKYVRIQKAAIDGFQKSVLELSRRQQELMTKYIRVALPWQLKVAIVCFSVFVLVSAGLFWF